jgi:hypothetical protein
MVRKSRRPDDDPDDDEILEDGATYRVPIHLMDARQRAIHEHFNNIDIRGDLAASLRDAQAKAREARAQMIDRASLAWKMGRDDVVEAPRRPTSMADAAAMRRAAYDQYCSRLTSAWRNPISPASSSLNYPRGQFSRDAAQPDLGTPPGDLTFNRVTPAEYATAFSRSPSSVMQPQRPDDNAQARRDRAYKEYCDRLGSAWKTPSSPAAAANSVEQQRRSWTNEDRR